MGAPLFSLGPSDPHKTTLGPTPRPDAILLFYVRTKDRWRKKKLFYTSDTVNNMLKRKRKSCRSVLQYYGKYGKTCKFFKKNLPGGWLTTRELMIWYDIAVSKIKKRMGEGDLVLGNSSRMQRKKNLSADNIILFGNCRKKKDIAATRKADKRWHRTEPARRWSVLSLFHLLSASFVLTI